MAVRWESSIVTSSKAARALFCSDQAVFTDAVVVVADCIVVTIIETILLVQFQEH